MVNVAWRIVETIATQRGRGRAVGSLTVGSGPDSTAGGRTSPAPAQWTAEVEVSPRLAAELIADQFPALGSSQVTLLAAGWDNTVMTVDGTWLFRFPRREVALAGVRREIALLPQLAPLLPLPVPDPRFAGRPSERYPWPFFGA